LKPNRSIPHSTVIPVLIYPDAREAVDWLGTVDVAPEEWGGTAVAGDGTSS
jgi:hypothetical protein